MKATRPRAFLLRPASGVYNQIAMTTKAIRERIFALPVAEKLTLIGELWDSIAEDQTSLLLSAEHAALLDERLAAHERDPSAVVSWEEAKKEALRRVAEVRKKNI